MQMARNRRLSRRRLWCTDTPLVASCIITLLLPCAGAASAPAGFSTFFMENAGIRSIGHDAAGNLYVLGVPSNGLAFVARLAMDASSIAWSVTLAGACAQGNAMAVDGAGDVFVAGGAAADNGKTYPCVLKLDPTGKTVYWLVVEHTAAGTGQAIAAESDGSAVISGFASELGFPAAGGGFSAPTSSVSGSSVYQPFVARINPDGVKVLAAAVGVGGSHIAIGPGGDVFVSGNVAGFGVANDPAKAYPVTPGALQTTFTPSFDCSFPCQLTFPSPEQYVSRLDPGLTRLIYSTYLTGSRGANHQSLAVDGVGNAYLTGTTPSTDYPYSRTAADGTRPGLFVTKLDPTGSKLVWSVQQGGGFLGLDAAGNLILGGSAWPPAGLPYQAGQYPPSPLPPTDGVPDTCVPNGIRVQIAAFVQRLDAGDGSVLATQFLAATRAEPSALDVLPDGRVFVGGSSIFPDVALTPGVVFSSAVAQRIVSGAFLAAFDLSTPSVGRHLACAADASSLMPVGAVAPGQLIALLGDGLGPAQPVVGSLSGPGPVPVTLGGVTVTFDGIAAPLAYVSSEQINVSVPWEVSGKASTMVTVMVDGNTVASRQFAVVPSNPSLWVDTGVKVSDGNSFFPGVALNADGSRNSRDNPAAVASIVTVFLNGVGAYPGGVPPTTGSVTGTAPTPAGVPVFVKSGTGTLEAGPLLLWPGMISGVYQLQVRMPGVDAGLRTIPITVTVGGVPGAPFVWIDQVYQAGGLIWMQ